MTIGLCMASEMTKLSCPLLPPSSPEVLRVSQGFTGRNILRLIRINH